MDERISRALAELKRAGISPIAFATQALEEEPVTNQEIADLIWAVAKQRATKTPNLQLAATPWYEDSQFVAFCNIRYWLSSLAYGNPPKPRAGGGLGDYIQIPIPSPDQIDAEAF